MIDNFCDMSPGIIVILLRYLSFNNCNLSLFLDRATTLAPNDIILLHKDLPIIPVAPVTKYVLFFSII